MVKRVLLAVSLLGLVGVSCGSDEAPREATAGAGGASAGSAGKASAGGGSAGKANAGSAAGGEAGEAGSAAGEGGAPPIVEEPEETDPEALARNAYLASRLELHRSAANLPALAAALVMGKRIVAANVVGVRTLGKSTKAKVSDYFMVKSCTKPMTGYLAARIVELAPKLAPSSTKKFSFETTILDVFPELADVTLPAYQKTTVAALMSHSTGMPGSPLGEAGTNEFSKFSSDLRERRFLYVKAAVQDPPLTPSPYGGGSIIVAAMLERMMGQTWEALMQKYVYDELGMINSGVGESPYPVSDRGVSSHSMSESGPVVWAPPDTYEEEVHAPAGRNPHASILDFARFAAANLPNVVGRAGGVSKATLLASQAAVPGTDDDTQGGWAIGSTPWDGAETRWHNGADGKDSTLMNVIPSQDLAMVSMTNYENEQPLGAMMGEMFLLSKYVDMASHYTEAGAAPKAATATDTFSGDTGYEAGKATDGLLNTRWATNGVTAAALTVQLGKSLSISHVNIAEPGDYPRVKAFTVSVLAAGNTWQNVGEGTAVGPHELVSFPAVTTTAVKVDITDSVSGPTIAEVWVD